MSRVLKHPVYAQHTDTTVTVYQAYSDAIGQAAVQAGSLNVPAFSKTRMTWIKPSFLWMMYRCGWAQKDEGQITVLALTLKRSAWDHLLDNACLSSFDPLVYADKDVWKQDLAKYPNRVQWDPERDFNFAPQDQRAIQVGIAGAFVDFYINEAILDLKDVTPLAHDMAAEVSAGHVLKAQALMPKETELKGNSKLISPNDRATRSIV